MGIKPTFYAKDGRLYLVWRVGAFGLTLLLLVSPLILINNALIQFFGATLALMLTLYIHAKYFDRRPFSNYGIRFNRYSVAHGLTGLFIGAISVGMMLVVGDLLGFLSLTPTLKQLELDLLLVFGLKMFFVAVLEEGLFRGYLFTNLNEYLQSKMNALNGSLIAAMILSSILFGLAHFGNDNASLMSMTLLSLNGLVWCIPFAITGNLWLSIGMHLSWNFTQSLLGFTMSGNEAVNSLFVIKNAGSAFWTGGAYGPEGGILGLLGFISMLLLSIAYLRIIPKGKFN